MPLLHGRAAPAVLLLAIVLIAAARTASTFGVFSATLDEPAHIAAGFDWWRGDYTTDPTHPPLERILSALPLVVSGVPGSTDPDFVRRGNDLLYHADRYSWHLALARSGNLAFLAVAIVIVALWTARSFGIGAGILAAFAFSLLPPVLGHAGMATTDLAVAAMWGVAMLALERFQTQPSARRAAVLGLAIGLGLLSKFSFIPFFAIGAAISLLVLPRPQTWRRHGPVAVLVAFVVVWAGYRFAIATIAASDPSGRVVVERLAPPPVQDTALWIADHVPLPAPGFLVGIGRVALHNRDRHPAYLFGECRDDGWWYYFPITLLYKTPVAWLLFAVIGAVGAAVTAWRRRDKAEARLLLHAIALLLFASSMAINIGVRHILPLYLPLAGLAAYGIVVCWRKMGGSIVGRTCVVALLAWLVVATSLAHPDYLAYFNEAAGRRPERILVDSNLDWGQDVLRLASFVRERQIDQISIFILFSADLPRHALPAVWLQPHTQPRGWIAVSATALALENCRSDGYQWLRQHRPVDRIGKSIAVYHIP